MAVACLNRPGVDLSLISPVQRLAGFQEEIQFEVLRRLHQSPDLSQRILAKELGISLGSINFCFQALVEKGWIKMQNFSQSKHKLRYAYLLTPTGIAEKSKLTAEFLQRKTVEYEALHKVIRQLESEIKN
jgi:EPS-associated MarR family transcriptional regulator